MPPTGFKDFTREQTKILLILTLVNFVNYVDRQILFPLFPFIGADFGLTYTELGALATVFTVVLSLASLPLGMAADRSSHRRVISFGVIFWSAATFLSGLAGSFRALLTARALVGVGEAAYTPAGQTIITAVFPYQVRARVQGIFNVGMFFGGAAGIVLGGIVAEYLGWRPAFFIVGVPGLLLGLAVFRLPETHSQRDREKAGIAIRDLLRVPAFLALLASGWFSSFAGYAYIAWGPMLVQEWKDFSAKEAGLTLGLTVLVSGVVGVMAGAALADRLARIAPWGRAATVPIGFLISAPFILGALLTESKVLFVILFGVGTFFMTWYHGPVTAVIHDLIPSRGHATALGLYNLFVNLFAMALAPMAIGKIADRSTLLMGMYAALGAQVIGGLLFLAVVHLIHKHGLRHPAMEPYRPREGAASEVKLPPAPAFAGSGTDIEGA